MIERLVSAIRAVDADVTSMDIADVLWLAGHLRPGGSPPTAVTTGGGVPPSAEPQRQLVTEPSPLSVAKPLPAKEEIEAQPGEEHASLRLPRTRLTDDPYGIDARSPAVPAIPDQLALCRSLRPLGRKMPSRKVLVPDEERTSARIADTGIWIPATRPRRELWLDVALVVDDSASMAVWAQTVAELRDLLQQTGSFRDVRVWYIDSDLPDGERLVVYSESGRDRSGRDLAELVDPTGRRLVLIATDCVGQAWGDGRMAPALTRWAQAGQAAIIQMLPQRLWSDCAPEFVKVLLRNPVPGAPNARFLLQGTGLDFDPAVAGVPIPVVQLEPRWLAPWASLASGTASGWVNGTAIFTARLAETDVSPVTTYPITALSARDQVDRFRARSSPEAYQLATFLAAAPLSLPVMRLVQQAIVPHSKPSDLAEVFLSDLLHSATPSDQVSRLDPDDIEYDFEPGVRAELLGQLSRKDALQVLVKVSSYVSSRLGSPFDFRALLTVDAPPQPAQLGSRPFARVAHQVLHSLGGRYADAARRLHRMGEINLLRRHVTAQRWDVAPPAGLPNEEPGADLSQTVTWTTVDDPRRQEAEPVVMRGVPLRNPHFTGRGDLIQALYSQLISGSERTALLPHTLHGLGGVGKTQLAVEYVYRHANEYELIYWIPAEKAEQVRPSLANLGKILGVAESVDLTQTVDAVLDALRLGRPYKKWLIVFDNADRPEDLIPFLPFPRGHVLITSRNASWTEVAATVEVDVLHREESVQLLQRRGRQISTEDAEELADRLGDLPLALEQAAAWQAETGMPVQEYLGLFDDQLDLLTSNPPRGYPVSLAATWRLSFNRLRVEAPDAAQLLEVCSFLGSEPIPVSLFWAGRNADVPAELAATLQDSVRLRRALREISKYALAKLDPVVDRVFVHRLVQTVLRAGLTAGEQETTMRSAQQILALANPTDPDNRNTWDRHAELSSHIVASGAVEADDIQVRRVVLDQIRYRWARGDYEGSRDLGEFVVERWREKWGEDEELTLIACRHLANTLRRLGESERAYALNENTLARLRRTFGDNHDHTLVTADSHAADLRRRGEFRKAKELDEDNLVRHRQTFGPDDQATVRTANNLAVNYRLLGDPRTARELDEDSLRRLRELLGDGHPLTLLSFSNLVRDRIGMGEYTEALRMQEEVFPRHREMLGPAHNDVLLAARNIVIALRKTGQYQQATVNAAEHLRACRRRFGPNHEYTLAAMSSLGNAMRDSGELLEARQNLENAFDRYTKVFGSEHPFTLACAINLAVVLRHLGEYRSALSLNERTRSDLIQALDEDHPAVLCCATNLSNDLAMLHEHQRARNMSADILARSRRVRGDRHPYTLACAINAALDLQSTGEQEAGVQAFDEALTELRQHLGEEHPEVLTIAAGGRADCDIEVSPT